MNNNNKQIVHIAKPMNLDKKGNIIEENKNEHQVINKTEYVNVFEKKDNTFLIKEIIIILIFIAILTAFFAYYVAPRLNESLTLEHKEEKQKTLTQVDIKSLNYNSGIDLTKSNTYIIDDLFKIEINNNKIFLNGLELEGNKVLSKTISRVDDILIIATTKDTYNSTIVYAINSKNDIIMKINELPNVDSMYIKSNIQIHDGLIELEASRLKDNLLTYDGITKDICSISNEDKISSNYPVIENVVIKYYGNETFGNPEVTYYQDLFTYKNNHC